MSQPSFPPVDPALTRGEALNMLLASIAMEELGLSHIINAEGEKIQYALKTLDGCDADCACAEDVLRVNKSVRELLATAMQYQILLKDKMEKVLEYIELPPPPPPPPPCPPKPPKPPKPPCPPKPPPVPERPEACCAAAFALPGRCRLSPGACFNWAARARCVSPACRAMDDCTAILLEPGFPLELSFLANIPCAGGGPIGVAVLLDCGGCACEVFTCYAPFSPRNLPVTLSFSGLILPARCGTGPARLRIALRAREAVCIERAQLVIRRL